MSSLVSRHKFTSNLFYSGAHIYIEYFLGLAISIIVARSLGPATFGVYAYLIWITGFCLILINGGISVAAIKFISELGGRGQTSAMLAMEKYFSGIQLKKAALLCISLTIITALFPSILVAEEHAYLLWLLIPAILAKSYHMFQVSIIKGRQEFRSLARIALLTAPLNVVFVGTAYFLLPTLVGYLVAFICTSIVYLLASHTGLLAIHRQEAVQAETEIDLNLKARVNKMLVYTSIIVIFGFITYGQSELVFLQHLGNANEIAFFSIGFVLARAAGGLIPGVYNTLLLPMVSFSVAQGEQAGASTLLTATRHMFYLGLLCCVPLAIFSEDIIIFLYGAEYRSAHIPTMIFALIIVGASVRDATNSYLVSTDQQELILKIVFALFFATILLDFILILEYGLLGAVIAYAAISFIATLIVSYFAFCQVGQWPSFGKMLRAIAAATISGFISYGLVAAAPIPGGFVIGSAVYGILFIILLFLLDAFEKDDYKAAQPFFADRSDSVSSAVARMLNRRLAASSRETRRRE